MADYIYLFGSMLNELVLEEIPCYGVYMEMEMNSGGQFQGTFQLDQTGKDNQTLLDATIPGRTWVTCERNGVPIWHGFVWSRVYSAQSKSVQLFGMSYENYPKKRIIDVDLEYFEQPTNAFINLWNQMQLATNSNVNINIPGPMSTAIPAMALTIKATDYRYYNEAMSELSDNENGFDWYIYVVKDGSIYRKDILIGTPLLGTPPNDGMTSFEYPGNITQYYMTEFMADAATDIFALGGGESSSAPIGHYQNTLMYSQGWPRWDTDVNRKDITSQDTMDAFAQQQALVRKPPMNVIKITVKGDRAPEFGSYNLGDTCAIFIKDARNPNGFRGNKRLLKWALTPPSSDDVEEASLVFEGDPDV